MWSGASKIDKKGPDHWISIKSLKKKMRLWYSWERKRVPEMNDIYSTSTLVNSGRKLDCFSYWSFYLIFIFCTGDCLLYLDSLQFSKNVLTKLYHVDDVSSKKPQSQTELAGQKQTNKWSILPKKSQNILKIKMS